MINGAGQTAFRSFLTGSGVTGTNERAIFSEGGGSGLALVAREGDAAPGTAAGVNFGGGFGNAVLNGVGQTAFLAQLAGPGLIGPGNAGIFSGSGGSGLVLVAQEGDAAPGTAGDVNFGSLGFLVLNGAGQSTFRSFLTGTDVNGSNNLGLFATDLDGILQLIARTGDLFDVNDDPLIDDFRTISFIDLVTGSGGEDGRPTPFNDAGQLAFSLNFTDGSGGIFVAGAPEPASVFLLGLGGLALLSRRRP